MTGRVVRRLERVKLMAVGAVAIVVALPAAGVSDAATIANRDKADLTLTLTKGSKSETRTVRAGEIVRDVCPTGCRVVWGSGNDYQIEAGDEVVIEGGFMYYDSPSTSPSGSPGAPSLRPGR